MAELAAEIASPRPRVVGMDTLPQEMTDRILDFLFDDRKALNMCGQVCSYWVSGSRYHLFATIHLQTRAWSNVETQRDLAILCNPGGTVQEYVQDLNIYGRNGRTNIIFGQLPNYPILRQLSSKPRWYRSLSTLCAGAKVDRKSNGHH